MVALLGITSKKLSDERSRCPSLHLCAWCSKALHILMRAAFKSTRMPSPENKRNPTPNKENSPSWWEISPSLRHHGTKHMAQQPGIKVFANHQLRALRLTSGNLPQISKDGSYTPELWKCPDKAV